MSTTVRALTYHHRSHPAGDPYVRPLGVLLPRETVEAADSPELLTADDEMARLNAAIRDHDAAALRLDREAAAADADYRGKVREAMAAGRDPSKIRNRADDLRQQAIAARELAREARTAAQAQGHVLGRLLGEHGRAMFGPADEVLAAKSAEVEAAVEALSAAWSEWARAWVVRRLLSHVALKGGRVPDYQPPAGPPARVGQALAALREELRQPDVLRSDEAEVDAWRAKEQAAVEANRRGLPRPLGAATEGAAR